MKEEKKKKKSKETCTWIISVEFKLDNVVWQLQ